MYEGINKFVLWYSKMKKDEIMRKP
jgi:hypothetical protein